MQHQHAADKLRRESRDNHIMWQFDKKPKARMGAQISKAKEIILCIAKFGRVVARDRSETF